MSQSVTTYQPRLPMPVGSSVDPDQWRVLTDVIFPAAKTPESIMLAMSYCAARKLDIMKRPVHIVPMYNKALKRDVETIWPGINELQVTAARTGQWGGMDTPKWGPDITRKFHGQSEWNGRIREYNAEVTFPEWCEVTVYRIINGVRCAFSEPVYWLEAYAKISRTEVPNDMWQHRTRGQLHKCAKAATLRAAFPEESGNDYTSDEMEGQDTVIGGTVIEHEAAQVSPPPAQVVDIMPPPAERKLTPTEQDAKRDKIEAKLTDLIAECAAVKTYDEAMALEATAGVQWFLKCKTQEWRQKMNDAIGDAHERIGPAPGEQGDEPPTETTPKTQTETYLGDTVPF